MAFPSLFEGFGMPVVEAALCGCNVVCHTLPVFREVIEGAKFVDFTDPQSGQDALVDALTSKNEQKVLTPVTWRDIATDLLNDLSNE